MLVSKRWLVLRKGSLPGSRPVSAFSMMPHLTKEASRSLTTDEKYMLWRLRLNTSYSTGSSWKPASDAAVGGKARISASQWYSVGGSQGKLHVRQRVPHQYTRLR